MLNRSGLAEMWGNLRVRQATTLYVASFAGIPLSVVTSIVFTRFLGPQGYGDFSFLDSLFDFARIIFPAGFFYAANRALVLNNDRQKAREYYGAALVYLFLLFAVMAAAMLVYGLLDPNLASKGLDRFFLLLLPFGWIFLLMPYFDNMLHADNRIRDLAATRLLPKLVTFSAAIIIYFLMHNYDGNRLAIIWPVYLLAFLAVYVLVFWRIRISFRNLKQRMSSILHHHRSYGIHLYVGALFSAGAVSLTGILISYFSDDNSGVGFFALAIAISRPLALIPGVIATTWFKDFSTQARISQRLFITTLLLSLIAFAALLLLAGPFVRLAYSNEFAPVIPLTYLAGAGMLFYGLGSFFNRFLEARGFGKLIRNTHILMGTALLVLNILLIPKHGTTGAAVAMIVASMIYLAGMWSGYMKAGK
jgi:O-antigen/teichoic acid export membrane protein